MAFLSCFEYRDDENKSRYRLRMCVATKERIVAKW